MLGAELGIDDGAELGEELGADDGEELGADEGEDEGAELGAEDGEDDGAELGEEEGADEGAVLGEEEGAELGEEEGADEGAELTVGEAVGDAVGLAEAVAVGLTVGEAVGDAVGLAVGEPVGDAVSSGTSMTGGEGEADDGGPRRPSPSPSPRARLTLRRPAARRRRGAFVAPRCPASMSVSVAGPARTAMRTWGARTTIACSTKSGARRRARVLPSEFPKATPRRFSFFSESGPRACSGDLDVTIHSWSRLRLRIASSLSAVFFVLAFDVRKQRILQQNSLAHARFTQQAKRGRRLLIEAVVLTEAVVGFAVRRRMVESASTVVLAERTIPIPLPFIPTAPTRAPTPPMAVGAGNPAPPTIAKKEFMEEAPAHDTTGLARTGTSTGTPREPPKRLQRGRRGT